jgi:hypothetical protein
MALFKQRAGGWQLHLTRGDGRGQGARQRHDKRGKDSQPTNRGAQLEAEAPSERRMEAIGKHDNQPNKRGTTAQQEVAAPGGGMTRGGERPVRRSTQHDNQANYMAATRSRGVMRGGARPRRWNMRSNAKQHDNQ